MNVTLLDDNVRYPSPWIVDWYRVKIRGKKRNRIQRTRNYAILTDRNPLPIQTGFLYEADVRNPYGFARGATRMIVTEGNVFTSVWPSLYPPQRLLDLIEGVFDVGESAGQSECRCKIQWMVSIFPPWSSKLTIRCCSLSLRAPAVTLLSGFSPRRKLLWKPSASAAGRETPIDLLRIMAVIGVLSGLTYKRGQTVNLHCVYRCVDPFTSFAYLSLQKNILSQAQLR